MTVVKKLIAWLLASKKVTALLAGLLLLGAKRLGLDIAGAEIEEALALLGAYLVGQGIADAGKERAKIDAASKVQP
jgi:hypothetical protein